MKVPKGLIPGEVFLPGLPTTAFSLCLYMVERQRESKIERESLGLSSTSYKDTNHILGEHTLMTLSKPNHPLQRPISKNHYVGG